MKTSPFILHHTQVQAGSPVGGKARALAILGQAGVPVPPWLVLTPDAFYESLNESQRTRLRQCSSAEAIQEIIRDVKLSASLQEVLSEALRQLCPNGERVAVRSSAMDEDGVEHSFAGQLESYLFVAPDEAAEKIVAVWQSGFTEQILSYRQGHHLGMMPLAPAVLIQKMVDATVSGVAFGADPVSGQTGTTVVSAVYGLGTSLVSGEADTDMFYVDPAGQITQRHIVTKESAARFSASHPDHLETHPVPESLRDVACLTDSQLGLLAHWVRYIGKTFGYPQDVEWAFVGRNLFILQSRPITTQLEDDANPWFYYWNNDNLDSWPGLTTPLTYSFVKRMYTAKFRHLCREMGAPKEKVEQNEPAFRRVVGLIQGRLYYNLSALEEIWGAVPWYPRYRNLFHNLIGGTYNKEQGLPPVTDPVAWVREHIPIFGALFRLLYRHLCWPRAIHEFFDYVNQVLVKSTVHYDKMNVDQLVRLYHELEPIFYLQWSKPTLNNFMASFFYTLLGKCTRNWCQDEDETLKNNLICGEGGIYSAEPIRYMEKLARLALQSDGLAEALCRGSVEEMHRAAEQAPLFYYHYQSFLCQYGERCHENLKLESPNIIDTPDALLRTVGQLARRLSQSDADILEPVDIYKPFPREQQIRLQAEARVQEELSAHPLRRMAFGWVLRNARARMRDRENMRFKQTLVMGRLRVIFKAIGRRLYEMDLLAHPDDVFYLEVEEVLGFAEATVTTHNLKGIVALRQEEFMGYRLQNPPPDSFETKSSACLGEITAIYQGDMVYYTGDQHEAGLASEGLYDEAEGLIGMSCAPGTASGPIRFARGPECHDLSGNEILIAEHGDPGLVMLFPSISGLLFEKGSPLSHLSIVAREMGIPTIVSIQGLTRSLKEGDWVEMDGKTGRIRKIDPPTAAEQPRE